MLFRLFAIARLIGDVLVERNVEETLPAVQRNKASIDAAIATLSTQFEARKKELAEFQTKYKIRLQGQDEEERGRPGPGNSAGVLVSNS